MKRSLSVVLGLSICSPLAAQSDPEQRARQLLDDFFVAFNAADNPAMRKLANFPHAFIFGNGRMQVSADASEFGIDFAGMRAREQWDKSTLDSVRAVDVSEDKVHFEIVFSRYRPDGTIYWTVPALWIVTRQDGHWGIQLRSLMPAIDSTSVAAAGPVISPEVSEDHMVTFRLRAPDAKSVKVVIAEIFRQVPDYDPSQAIGRNRDDAVDLVRGTDGVWSRTVGPIIPDKYDYVFDVDGVRVLDPGNMDIKPGRIALENWLTVRGAEPLYSDHKDVPHGAVSRVPYQSKSLGKNRYVNVYTPPGYAATDDRYPVLYLLHGNSNSYQTWVKGGDANFIMDNLIAEGRAVPMIVVMPGGHVPPGSAQPPAGTPGGAFGADLVEDVIGVVESQFRTLADQEHRAIVGLSMGAGQAAAIGFARLDLFSHIGLMSGGGLRGGNLPAYIPDAETVNDSLALLWIGRGEGENAQGARDFSAALGDKGIEHVLHISDFGHSWITWRRDLYYQIGPRLFRDSR